MHSFQHKDATIHYQSIGEADAPVIIWGHGWGQSHQAFLPLATSLAQLGRHIIIDFPGFGSSPVPENGGNWGSFEYAEAMADFIQTTFPEQRIIWIGHSFGCRVGTQLAAHHPDLVERMVFIGGAGLPRKRSLYFKARVTLFKILKHLPLINKDKLRKKFGSSDYLSAGEMRETFLSVIRENLSDEAQKVTCPVQLIYGTNDTETPPEIGRRYQSLMQDARMVELEGQDHYSVLSNGRHQVVHLIKQFITKASS